MTRGGLLLALLVMSALSGCADTEADAPETASGTTPGPGSPAYATLAGTVLDDAGRGVPGARLVVTGTASFASTGEDGGFLLEGLPTGSFLLRAEKSGYNVAEKEVELVANQTVEVELVLIPDDRLTGDERDHVHDYWGPLDQMLLMDQSFSFTEDTQSGTAQSNALSGAVLYATFGGTYHYEFQLPEAVADDRVPSGQAALIYPGTAEMHVTFTWEQTDATFGTVVFNGEPPGEDLVQSPDLASGETFVVPLTPEMADNGHQGFTRWEFAFDSGNNVQSAEPPAVAPGSIHIKIELVKGEVPLEPAHPRFWENGTEYMVRDITTAYKYNIAVNQMSRHTYHDGIRPEEIVPPGTTRMTVQLCWEYTASLEDSVGPAFEAIWKTADQSRERIPLSEYRSADGTLEGNCRSYEFPVEPTWADAYYDRSSLWRFYPYEEGLRDQDYFAQQGRATGLTLYLGIVAYNDDL